MEFTPQDIQQIKELGKTPEEVQDQLERFVNGFPDIELLSAVSDGNGLYSLSANEVKKYISKYDEESQEKKLLKFVPASGAASRMFKNLYNYLDGQISEQDKDIQAFFDGIKNFAFYEELCSLLGDRCEELIQKKDKKVVEFVLDKKGLNYGSLPKALLTFHNYENGNTSKAIDEHLVEGSLYCPASDDKVSIHFTVSKEHLELIKTHLAASIPIFEKQYNKHFEITFSIQDKATDTIAVNRNNKAIRKENGELLFRPGGHGALLKNLDAIDADLIFIKNIDNVAAQCLIQDTVDYKKALGGILFEIQEKIYTYCKTLKNEELIDEILEKDILSFMKLTLGYVPPKIYHKLGKKDKTVSLFQKLNRPLRICGVIESSNTGGGPFWVKHPDGAESLQLVETAQVNMLNPAQKEILESSLYANITDLVCGVKDFEGKKFDLMKFRDSDTGFIAEKSQGGQTLKAMELPGLWNGAMSDWNTIFVKVPASTFNPVKTVIDLLNKEHQG